MNDDNHRGGPHMARRKRSLSPADPAVRIGVTGEQEMTGQLKARQTWPAGLQFGPRTVYSTLTDSHKTLSGQTTIS